MTPKLITLGLDVAQSGAAAPTTFSFVSGIQTFWFGQNAHGGVCGRQVKLIYGDNGGNAQQGATVYTQMQPQVLAFQQLSPSTALVGLASQWTSDNVMVSGSSTVSALFGQKNYVPVVTDWGHAALDSVDWLMKNRGLKAGDTVGLLYGVGAFGDDAKAGIAYAAQSRGLKPVFAQVAGTDTDMSAPMLSFKQAGANFVVLIALAPQDNNAIAAADSINYKPQFVAGSFLPSALNTSIAATLKSSRYLLIGNGGSTSTTTLSSTQPAVKQAVATYTKFFHKPPADSAVLYGYAQGYLYKEAMKAACGPGKKDPKNPKRKIYAPLTRNSLANAFLGIKNLNMQGFIPNLNFTLVKSKLPPTLDTFISVVDTSVLGSIKPITGFFHASDAASFHG